MRTRISTKYQVTIPRAVRQALKLRSTDTLEWHNEIGGVSVRKVGHAAPSLRGRIKVGRGSIKHDIEAARSAMATRFAQ
jgi:bifunctional DNA-binding transcriptional regulator/antitoxin component of YhaV-PrlF toxin-antitoxin module